MVKRAENRTVEQIIHDYLSAKARTDILGNNFKPTDQQLNELKSIITAFGIHSLSRSRNSTVLSKKTLEQVIPRFLKFNITGFVSRLKKIDELTSKNCKEYYILAYGEEEANKFWENKSNKCKRSEKSLGTEKWNEWRSKLTRSLLDRWSEKYGEEIAKIKYDTYIKNLSRKRTLAGFIETYGEELGRQKYIERYNNAVSIEYKSYARKVRRLSNRVYQENIEKINPKRHPRTLCGVENGWQLDHIIPIKECYEKGITVEKASSIENLRLLPWKDNLMRNYGYKI